MLTKREVNPIKKFKGKFTLNLCKLGHFISGKKEFLALKWYIFQKRVSTFAPKCFFL